MSWSGGWSRILDSAGRLDEAKEGFQFYLSVDKFNPRALQACIYSHFLLLFPFLHRNSTFPILYVLGKDYALPINILWVKLKPFVKNLKCALFSNVLYNCQMTSSLHVAGLMGHFVAM